MTKPIKVFYGQTATLQQYCDYCKMYAFVIDGILQCCGEPVIKPKEATVLRLRREVDAIVRRPKVCRGTSNVLVDKQDNRCMYCGKRFGSYYIYRNRLHIRTVHIDHFWAWSGSHLHMGNLVAACNLCNSLKSSRFFSTIQEASKYLKEKLAQKITWEEDD